MKRALFALGIATLVVAPFTISLAQSVNLSSIAGAGGSDACTGQACSVQSLVSSSSVTSLAPSGQYALEVTTAGARVGMGPGVNQWLTCPTGAYCGTDSLMRFGGGVDLYNGSLADTFGGAVRVNAINGLAVLVQGVAEPTCTSGFAYSGPTRNVGPGTIFTMLGAGGRPTRYCACTFDGTAYRWYNLGASWDATGTTTTCPTGALPTAQVFVNELTPSATLNSTAAVPGARIGDHITCTLVPTSPASVVSIPSGVVVGQCFVGTDGQVVIAFANNSSAFTVQPFSVTFSFKVTRP